MIGLKKRLIEVSIPDEDGELETIESNSSYYRIDTTQSLDLKTALSKIKPQYQTVIFLYYQQGFIYEEIAGIMKIPLGTVKTLLYRAKKALVEELK